MNKKNEKNAFHVWPKKRNILINTDIEKYTITGY